MQAAANEDSGEQPESTTAAKINTIFGSRERLIISALRLLVFSARNRLLDFAAIVPSFGWQL